MMMPIPYERARFRLFLLVGFSHLVIALLFAFGSMAIDLASFAPIYLAIMPFCALALYARRIALGRLAVALEVVSAGWLMVVPILASTYYAIGVGLPLADGRLAAWDAALGFDWRAFIAFVDARPTLSNALWFAYDSFSRQLIFLPVFLAFTGQTRRAYAFVFAYAVVCFASSAVAVWFPATGAYVSYGVAAQDVVNVHTKFGFQFLDQFYAVHDQKDFVLRLENEILGILTFPSVHAGVAGLCAWGAWRSPTLRWPFLFLNVAMAISALSHGGHYLVDVLAGLATAALSVALVKVVFSDPSPLVSSRTPSLVSA